jgi:hypothetical protein
VGVVNCQPIDNMSSACAKTAEAIAASRGFTLAELLPRDRTRPLAWTRQHIWAELHASGIGYRRIAKLFGVHKTTVQYGVDAHLNRQPRARRAI